MWRHDLTSLILPGKGASAFFSFSSPISEVVPHHLLRCLFRTDFRLAAITAIVLAYLIAFWAIFTGVFEIIAAIGRRKTISNEWLLLLIGVLSLLF